MYVFENILLFHLQHVYRQAAAVHRAASAFNTGLRGEEQYHQGVSGVGGPMSPPPFPPEQPGSPGMSPPPPPPHPASDAMYGADSPRQPQYANDDGSGAGMNPGYGAYPQQRPMYSPPPSPGRQYSENGSTVPGVNVNVDQTSPAMQAIIKATQIIFQAADPAGIGQLSRDMAYRVLDMVWGRSAEGSPDESGPRGVLRLSFDRAFEQQPELTVEDFISILAKVGAPPPYRSQELEYAIITSAKYLQAEEDSSLDWRSLFLPVIMLGLSAFSAGFALDVCYKAIPSFVRDGGSCKAIGSTDFKRITDDAYGFHAIFIHAPVILVLHLMAVFGLSKYPELNISIGSQRRPWRWLWESTSALDASSPVVKSMSYFVLTMAVSILSPTMMVILLLSDRRTFSKDEHTIQLVALNYCMVACILTFRGILSFRPRTGKGDMSAKRDSNELHIVDMTIPHRSSSSTAYSLARDLVRKSAKKNITDFDKNVLPFILFFSAIPLLMGFAPMFVALYDKDMCWGTYGNDHGVFTTGYIITSFVALWTFQVECYDLAAVHQARERMMKHIGALLHPAAALESGMPFLNLSLPGNMQAWMKMRCFMLKHFLVGEAAHPWLPHARGGWGIDCLMFTHLLFLFLLIVGSFAELKVLQLHFFYTVIVTGYFAYSGEGALPCLVRAWEHARSHGQFLQEQALSLNMAYDRYLMSTSEDGKDAQQAMRDMAQVCDMSLVHPPRVLGIAANGITLMIWRMISVVGIALAIVKMCYWT